MKNIFDKAVAQEVIERINKLTVASKPLWGKMTVDQMLAHLNVTYEFLYEDKHPKPKGITKWILKTFIKKIVVGEKAYAKNSRTAPEFLVTSEKDFLFEKERLNSNIMRTLELGTEYFDNRESHSFGKLTISEWNIMFYKHLDHHLSQFGV
ncbi:DUF1569 domain-containing protein [Brumimicrobium mesophilum]|uniref:DUF1569 domain-containing protein n=1 Tax=Brumimicrobium mesophilum TaxID=392717 RepID=UPI000D143293|nr:DUF1569 domain-containing protein [Brumimicrobium mesophilum]